MLCFIGGQWRIPCIANKASLYCKQGFFVLQIRLLRSANKASFGCKQALFEGENEGVCCANKACFKGKTSLPSPECSFLDAFFIEERGVGTLECKFMMSKKITIGRAVLTFHFAFCNHRNIFFITFAWRNRRVRKISLDSLFMRGGGATRETPYNRIILKAKKL